MTTYSEKQVAALDSMIKPAPPTSEAATMAVFQYEPGTPEYARACRDYRREMYLHFARDLGRRAGGLVYRAVLEDTI